MKQENNDKKSHRIKLEDIPKRNFQQVPEGYFDTLAGEIRTKIDAKKDAPVFSIGFNWQTATIAAAMALVMVFSGIFTQPEQMSAEQILAGVTTEDIIEYLDYSEITTDELISVLNISEDEIDDFVENDIYILNENELESLDEVDLFNEFGIEEQVF